MQLNKKKIKNKKALTLEFFVNLPEMRKSG